VLGRQKAGNRQEKETECIGEKEERNGEQAEQREGYLLRVQAQACTSHPSIHWGQLELMQLSEASMRALERAVAEWAWRIQMCIRKLPPEASQFWRHTWMPTDH